MANYGHPQLNIESNDKRKHTHWNAKRDDKLHHHLGRGESNMWILQPQSKHALRYLKQKKYTLQITLELLRRKSEAVHHI
jgi:hypothetical protein